MIGMSGGVDSSVAAALLIEQGYEVVGATFRLWKPEDDLFDSEATCCSLDDINDAREVCHQLGIPHYVFNLKREFKEAVVQNFVEEYQAGRTPNPCIVCNQKIKFDYFSQKAAALGFDYVATGHYARIEQNEQGQYQLKTAAYAQKDQSYFLYGIPYPNLAHILFPLGGYTKPQVRELAEKYGFSVSHKRDSQEICFVDRSGYGAFLERFTETIPPKGNFIDSKGTVLGQHKGIWHYTVGQRKGLGMAFGKPMYVSEINPVDNTVRLVDDEENYSSRLTAERMNYLIPYPPSKPIRVQVKIRNRAEFAPALLTPLSETKIQLAFDQPQRAITKGQSAVLYDGDICLGGGIITA